MVMLPTTNKSVCVVELFSLFFFTFFFLSFSSFLPFFLQFFLPLFLSFVLVPRRCKTEST